MDWFEVGRKDGFEGTPDMKLSQIRSEVRLLDLEYREISSELSYEKRELKNQKDLIKSTIF